MRIRKNGKVIRLTESDLRRITKKVLREQESSNKTLVNKVKTEGLKNISDKMINSNAFKGSHSGYVLRGVFDGVTYEWDMRGVEGMLGVRGMVDGYITSAKNDVLGKYGINDAQTSSGQVTSKFGTEPPENPEDLFNESGNRWVGFYNPDNKSQFGCYMTKSGTPKCQRFNIQ